MKFLQHSWLIVLTLFAAVNTGLAEPVIGSGGRGANDTTPLQITTGLPAELKIETRSVEIPVNLVSQLAGRIVKVGNHQDLSLQLKQIHLRGDRVVVIGQRLVPQQAARQRQRSFLLQEVRVTFPRHYLATSWDVQSLQRELERLGIKIKPKPAGPKSTQQLSG